MQINERFNPMAFRLIRCARITKCYLNVYIGSLLFYVLRGIRKQEFARSSHSALTQYASPQSFGVIAFLSSSVGLIMFFFPLILLMLLWSTVGPVILITRLDCANMNRDKLTLFHTCLSCTVLTVRMSTGCSYYSGFTHLTLRCDQAIIRNSSSAPLHI